MLRRRRLGVERRRRRLLGDDCLAALLLRDGGRADSGCGDRGAGHGGMEATTCEHGCLSVSRGGGSPRAYGERIERRLGPAQWHRGQVPS
ncbi:MAG: hypothetical protein ACK55I_33570, partial [bacterium]